MRESGIFNVSSALGADLGGEPRVQCGEGEYWNGSDCIKVSTQNGADSRKGLLLVAGLAVVGVAAYFIISSKG